METITTPVNSRPDKATIPKEAAKDDRSSKPTRQHWQEHLLPLMVRMVVGLTLFFFIASFAQLAYLHMSIRQAPHLELPDIVNDPNALQKGMSYQYKVLAVLEANILERRYHQANVFLMSRVWGRYLGFVTGMILALVGAAFILGKLREGASEINAKGAVGVFSMRSTSPGLILAVLGVALMVMTIVTHHEIETTDRPVYINLADPGSKPIVDIIPPFSAQPDAGSGADSLSVFPWKP